MSRAGDLWQDYLWRRRRQLRLARALRKRRELASVVDRTDLIRPGDVLAFTTLRNEAARLPFFLAHYRALGVRHFLVVDNDSDDGSREILGEAPDVSLWHTRASYRASRFGVDWMQGLLMRYGRGHWCVSVDADELLVYPHHDTRPLPALCDFLDGEGEASFGALMLDLYPQGPLDAVRYTPGQDPTAVLPFYDRANYTISRKRDLDALWIQGGPRSRTFFADRPERGPTLTKVPLVKWHWRYAYVNSTHTLLPRALNRIYDDQGGEKLSGVLLHTKFLPGIGAKSAEEKTRRQHFGEPGAFDAYYDALIAAPDLWTPHSTQYRGWRQLEAEGLMSRGGWG
ncbi:glycosyltransferase family 2 protein [Pararhodobacter sp. CCB-MM2]|uniref:glycosyltransferase family 2 protein n=1 Tax=Pararhodobacter sp. CCB-MM2 TaxID=1786003 RepID=UPI0008367551|nr:glycosyltransferase family 2 protein [Pararhodobacter sp. CCB-MM2]